jgi:rubrerythrin
MTTLSDSIPLWMRLAAPLAFRSERRIAIKLHGFAATEQGSALDMLLAAQATPNPRLVRLFSKHALDESRHAARFREMATALDPRATTRGSERGRARPEHLYERLGELDFVAFVYVSEARARQQFLALAAHFEGHPQLGPLFADIAREERFHEAYSGRLLDEWRAQGLGPEVSRALRRVRLGAAWSGWRRSGRRLGDLMSLGFLWVLWLTVIPVFALTQRLAARRARGWQARQTILDPDRDSRLQF